MEHRRLQEAIRYRLERFADHLARRRYHIWYYERARVWEHTSWLGTPARKFASDMWSYQEILWELKPSLVVEFGVQQGGSTLFFTTVMPQIREDWRLLGVDITLERVDERVRRHPQVTLMESSSTDPAVAEAVRDLRGRGPVFAVLDSDHSKQHVLAELRLITPLLERGDYLVVEDSNINGHPVERGWGEGPYEAIGEFLASHPDAYLADRGREQKFGLTAAPKGFLVRSGAPLVDR